MWDERYAQEGYLFGTAPAVFLERHRDRLRRGCDRAGDRRRRGPQLGVHGGAGSVTVTAMDGSAVAVAKARALADERGVAVDFNVADILTWDWQAGGLRPGGRHLLPVPGPGAAPAGLRGHEADPAPRRRRCWCTGTGPSRSTTAPAARRSGRTCTPRTLLTDAFGDLQIEVLESYDAEIAEGTGHVGTSALIDLVATKPT
jgi:hypothetical protein